MWERSVASVILAVFFACVVYACASTSYDVHEVTVVDVDGNPVVDAQVLGVTYQGQTETMYTDGLGHAWVKVPRQMEGYLVARKKGMQSVGEPLLYWLTRQTRWNFEMKDRLEF